MPSSCAASLERNGTGVVCAHAKVSSIHGAVHDGVACHPARCTKALWSAADGDGSIACQVRPQSQHKLVGRQDQQHQHSMICLSCFLLFFSQQGRTATGRRASAPAVGTSRPLVSALEPSAPGSAFLAARLMTESSGASNREPAGIQSASLS